MQVKTSELNDNALDWAVAKCEGLLKDQGGNLELFGTKLKVHPSSLGVVFTPSTDWSQGGPIIEQEKISLFEGVNNWSAKTSVDHPLWDKRWEASTPLIAAMRCYVASKFGDTVEIPDQLL